MNSLSDQYLVKAMDNYPFNLAEAVESLNYALSYDEENPVALKLMGQIYAEQFSNYPRAISYFEKALAADPKYVEIFSHLITALTEYGNYDQALKAADYALTLKGINRGAILMDKGFCFEHMEKYKKALTCLKESKKNTFNTNFMHDVQASIDRVKAKIAAKKKDKKSKKTKSK